MTRNSAREIAVQIIYGADLIESSYKDFADNLLSEEYYSTLAEDSELYSEYPDDWQKEYILRVVSSAWEHKDEIDGIITKYSKTWSLNRISGTALAVIRCAICEILYMDDIPDAAAINSAVDISKKYDDAATVSFINGVLGNVVRCEKENKGE